MTRRGDVDATAEGLDWTGTTDDLDPLLAANIRRLLAGEPLRNVVAVAR